MGYSKSNRRKGNVIKSRRTRGGNGSGSRSSSSSSAQSSGWYLFSPRCGLSAILAASLLVALTSLRYLHHRGQQEATRITSTKARGDGKVIESDLEGSSAAIKRGFQSNDEAFTVLHGLRTTAAGGSIMTEEVPEGRKVETNRSPGGLRESPTSEREIAFSDGREEMLERVTEGELRAMGSQEEKGWLSALKNLVLGASERVEEPVAMENAVTGAIGEVDREAAGGVVPEWVRPSRQELEDIVRAQFGPWRTLSDASPEAFANGSVGATHGGCSPMQQGMAPYQEDHLYRCYAEMRQDYKFGAPLRQVAVVTMGEDKAVKSSPRGVVTFMSTSRPNDLNSLKKALRALSTNFLDEHRYPVAIIHEDFSTELMGKLRDLVPVPIHFVEVEFKLPDWIEPLSWIYPLAVKHYTGHPKSIPLVGFHSDMHGLLPYVKRGSFGYFHMCRFFGGAGYMLPFFDNFDLYLRLDSDSFCSQRLPDYFMKLEKAGADYAFDSTFLDYGDKAQGLWNFAEEYMRDRNISPTFWKHAKRGGRIAQVLAKAKERPPYPKCSNQSPQKETVVSIQGTKIHPVPCRDRHFQAVPAFYTNFEVARIKMLRSSWYQDWFNAIDKSGSIFYNRWGDAPIRFIGLSMHLPEDKILRVSGCHHD